MMVVTITDKDIRPFARARDGLGNYLARHYPGRVVKEITRDWALRAYEVEFADICHPQR